MIPSELRPLYVAMGPFQGKVVHIAGSKGKGSTAVLLSRLLEWNGHRVGTFTSPFFLEEEEMIQVNGVAIPKERLVTLKARFPELSEFEQQTFAALEFFKEEACDYAVLECGWGGAKDATNVVDEKTLTLLTHIELEHTAVLGKTLEEITEEKLGIVRPGVPLLTLKSQKEAVKNTILELFPSAEFIDGQGLSTHHPDVAGLVLASAKKLGLSVDKERLGKVQIPGRFEVVPFGIHTLTLDVAHTLDSVSFVKKSLHADSWAVHFLSDKSLDLPALFENENKVWIMLQDDRAGKIPNSWRALSMEEFLTELSKNKTPQHIGMLGSFKLLARFKKIHDGFVPK